MINEVNNKNCSNRLSCTKNIGNFITDTIGLEIKPQITSRVCKICGNNEIQNADLIDNSFWICDKCICKLAELISVKDNIIDIVLR